MFAVTAWMTLAPSPGEAFGQARHGSRDVVQRNSPYRFRWMTLVHEISSTLTVAHSALCRGFVGACPGGYNISTDFLGPTSDRLGPIDWAGPLVPATASRGEY
jgi:hypothetical protein